MEDKILNLLSKKNLNITQISSKLNKERHTISKYLKSLESKHKIVSTHKGKSKIYKATNPILEFFKNEEEVSKSVKILLENIKEHVSVQNKDFEVIWSNKNFEKGKKCFQLYANRRDVCPNCPAHETFKTNKLTTRRVDTLNKEISIFPIENAKKEVIGVIELAKVN